jgi:hypothetical protein
MYARVEVLLEDFGAGMYLKHFIRLGLCHFVILGVAHVLMYVRSYSG